MDAELAKLCNPDCTKDLVCLFEYAEYVQYILNRFVSAVAPSITNCLPSSCKVLLQDWKPVVPRLVTDEEDLTIVDRFNYLSSCMSKD